MGSDNELIEVEVAYALPERQCILRLRVPVGSSAYEAVRCSEVGSLFADLDVERAVLGIFGKVLDAPRRHVLQPGDRIEIYRPLLSDPREARRQRAREG